MGNDRTRLSPRRLSRRDGYLLTNSVVLAWLVLAVAAIVGHRFVSQPLWLLVHVPLLGAATAAILVWSQHFADTLLRRPVPGGRPGLAVRLGLHSLGTLMLGGGVLAGVPALAIAGGSVVAAAIAVHLGLLGMQSRGALPARFAPLVRYYLAAGAVFLVGIAVGVVMAVVRDPALTDRAVTAHLVLNVYGWIGLTALGTLVLLWPTVLHARVEPAADRAAARALPLLVAGIAVAALASAVDVRALVAAGMVGWLAGLALLGREGVRQARAMPPGTFAGWSLAAATGWLAVSAVALGVAAMAAPDWATFRASTVALLGPLVAGFGVQVLLGALSHLLPVVALGSPAAARAGAAELDRGGAFRATAFNGAIAIYLLPMPSLARCCCRSWPSGWRWRRSCSPCAPWSSAAASDAARARRPIGAES
ncbi:hypothetical protein [Microbacterium radiodurans]|uniref:hypothetical protein n=1 Tax=Microbacterium radiodurans TaxID=661398 RepID=UPI001CC395A3|nr:hypothetical protein [Microbacterium radiodurans]